MDLVENDANLVVVAAKGLDGTTKLVRYVQFVGIKQENDPIDSFCKPFEDTSKIVTAVDALLLTRQDSRSVNDRDAFKDG